MREVRKGFTLTEMLVALAILAIVAGLIVAPLMTGMKLTVKGQARIEAQDASRMAMEQIRRDLMEAVRVFSNTSQFLGPFGYIDIQFPQQTGRLLTPVRPEDCIIRYYTMLKLQHDDPTNPNALNHDPDTNPFVLYRARIPLSEYEKFDGDQPTDRHPTAADLAQGVASSSVTPKECDVPAFEVSPALVRNNFLKPLDRASTRFVAKFPLWLWSDDGDGLPESGEGFSVVVLNPAGVPLSPQPSVSEVSPERGVVDFGFETFGLVENITGDGDYTGTNMTARVSGRWVELLPDVEGVTGERLVPESDSLFVKEGSSASWTAYKRVASGQGLPQGMRWYRLDPDPNAPLEVRVIVHLPRDISPGEVWAIRLNYRYTFLPNPESQRVKVVATYKTYALLDLLLSVVKYDIEGKPQGVRLSTKVRAMNAFPGERR